MMLYSWFSRNKKEPNTKTNINNKNIDSELSKASQSVQCIESYTMWPTAKIKPNVKVTLPSFSSVDEPPIQPQQSVVDIALK